MKKITITIVFMVLVRTLMFSQAPLVNGELEKVYNYVSISYYDSDKEEFVEDKSGEVTGLFFCYMNDNNNVISTYSSGGLFIEVIGNEIIENEEEDITQWAGKNLYGERVVFTLDDNALIIMAGNVEYALAK